LGYVEKQDGDHRRLETETEFLNRMSGLIRLFCKLLVRGGPPFDKDLSFAWTWCADVANLPPRSNISSVLLRVYLDEAGEVMIRAYPMQFPKIIKYIQTQYLPRLEKVTSADQIARFRLTLDMFKDKI
jgi:nucleoporin GLE1